MPCLEFKNLIVRDKNQQSNVTITLSLPDISPKGDYACHLICKGLSTILDKDVFGVTPQQAMSLAIRVANQHIYDSSAFEARKIYCIFADGSENLLEFGMLGEQLSENG